MNKMSREEARRVQGRTTLGGRSVFGIVNVAYLLKLMRGYGLLLYRVVRRTLIPVKAMLICHREG